MKITEADDLLIRLDAFIRTRDLKLDGTCTHYVNWQYCQDVLRDIRGYLSRLRGRLAKENCKHSYVTGLGGAIVCMHCGEVQ